MRKAEEKSQPFARILRRKMTKTEVVLWNHLRTANRHGYHFRRQHPVGPYIVDFASVKDRLVIEIDGDTHGTLSGIRHDARRDAYLKSRGWSVVRVFNLDVHADAQRIVEIILERLPPPSRNVCCVTTPP
jgi:very-short-patch-repair endonuclease